MELFTKGKAALFIIFCVLISLIYNFDFKLFDDIKFRQIIIKTIEDDINYLDETISLLSQNFTVGELLNQIWNLDGYSNNSSPDCSQSLSLLKKWKHNISPGFHVNLAKNCSLFKSLWHFPDKPYSQEEAEYPLAYVFMGYKNVPQTLRLFRAIYQPQNVYCLNWDNKSISDYHKAMKHLSSCFSNVIVPKYRRKIKWCAYSLLQAVMDCLELLRYTKRAWKYVQIVSWNDFPLKTNREMVQIMKILNGAMDVSLIKPIFQQFHNVNHPNPVLPGGLVLYKSSYAVTMAREFVTFMFANEIARELYLWFNNTVFCTEEMFFSTLAHNVFLKAPGGFPGSCLQNYNDSEDRKQFISRYQVWRNQKSLCKGFLRQSSCVYGIGNVHELKKQYALIAHKLYETFQPAALYCLEEWHYSKMYAQTKLTADMIKFYSNMQSVRYHKLSDKLKNSFVC